jgi:hypothetical protein
MAPTQLADWFAAHAAARMQGHVRSRPQFAADYLNYLWPISTDYSSPLNPFFLVEAEDASTLVSHRVWMARDGLIPLLWFFKRNPTPRGFEGDLLVSAEFADYVPPAWTKQVGLFELVSTLGTAVKKPKSLLITGISMETYCSIPMLDKIVSGLTKSFGDLKNMNVQTFLPGRFDGWGTENAQDFHLKYYVRLSEAFGGRKIQGLNWTQVEAWGDLTGCAIVDLNEKLLCADSYLVHHAMSRGANYWSLSKSQMSRNADFVRISPFHGLRVQRAVKAKAWKGWNSHTLERFENAMSSEANKRFPWPNWFTDWALIANQARHGSRSLRAEKFSKAF